MNFYTHVTKSEFWGQWVRVLFQQQFTTFQEWDENYGPTFNPEAATKLYTVMQMYEGAGVLLKTKAIRPEILFSYLPQMTVNSTWIKFWLWIEGLRKAYDDPTFGGMFEYLFAEVRRLYPNLQNPRHIGTRDPTFVYPVNSKERGKIELV